eukprot:659448_1
MTAQPKRGNERTIRIFRTFHFSNIFNDLVDHPSKLTTHCIRPDCPLEKDLWDLAAMQGADDNSPENFAFLKELIPWFTTGATEGQMRTVFDDYIGPHDEKVNLDGTILKQLRQCSDLTFKPDGVFLDTRTRTLPPTAGKQTMSSMLGGSEVACPVNIWWKAAKDIERFIEGQSWATLKNKIRNANLSNRDIVLKLKDFMDDHNAELNTRDPGSVNVVSAHSGYFNDHFGHYPQRYHVNDVNDYHVDDYLYTYPRVGYGNGYGYEHVHPLVQPQLSTSNGNDSMQYGLMIIGLALFIFLMLCVTFTVLSGVCFAIGRVSNARKSDKIPYEVIEELTV